ncbi:MAG: type II toxin-antitoxin system RelE/ParE family toxin [Pirellulaceae bacterium]
MTWPPAHHEAREDFRSAVAYFRNEVSNALAQRFALQAMSTVRRARQFPSSGSPIGGEARRMPIKPFSYDLVYLPAFEGDIYIVAFAHHRRRPGYWRARLGESNQD